MSESGTYRGLLAVRPGLRERSPGSVAVATAVLLLLIYAFVNPGFLAPFQLQTSANAIAPLAFVALAQLLVVLTGGIDVSVAAVFSLANVVTVVAGGSHGVLIGVLAGLATATACGALNSWISIRFNVALIVVTLATSFIFGAAALQILDRPGGSVAPELVWLTSGLLGGVVPVALVWVALGGLAVSWLLRSTTFGMAVIGVGSSAQGIEAAGMSPARTLLGTGAASGLLIGVGAVILAGGNATGDPVSGSPYLLLSIAAVAFGGADFTGGVGSVWGALAGAVVLSIIGFVLFFANITSYWQYVITSAVILVAVAVPRVLTWTQASWRLSRS